MLRPLHQPRLRKRALAQEVAPNTFVLQQGLPEPVRAPVSWGTFTLPAATQGQPYSYNMAQHAPNADSTTLKSGTLPAGVTYTHPYLSGTPTASGTFANLIFTATGQGGQSVDSPAKTLTVGT